MFPFFIAQNFLVYKVKPVSAILSTLISFPLQFLRTKSLHYKLSIDCFRFCKFLDFLSDPEIQTFDNKFILLTVTDWKIFLYTRFLKCSQNNWIKIDLNKSSETVNRTQCLTQSLHSNFTAGARKLGRFHYFNSIFSIFQHSLFLRITTLLSWLKSTLSLKNKCFDTHIYMKTQCLQTKKIQHSLERERLEKWVGKENTLP